ncbi:MAG: dehydratase [Actinophytocola sp.]|nr:dehydratase [Actinophytocola sp.]
MDTESDAGFDAGGVGVWTDEDDFEVTRERMIAYAEATNDPIDAHRTGEVAPPVFAIVPVFNALLPAVLSVAPVEAAIRIVHGEQDFLFHRPIRAGDVLTSRARPIGFAGKPSGSTVTVHIESRDANHELVNEQWVTSFFRNVDAGATVGDPAPAHDVGTAGAPVADVRAHVDEDQTFRYSPAAGDPMPIHLDEDIAKLAGLPGIIAHGLCMLAFTSWAVLTEVAGGRTDRLRRLAVRFAKPVLPGQDLTTSIWDAGDGRYAYESTVGDTVVIKNGLAEIV